MSTENTISQTTELSAEANDLKAWSKPELNAVSQNAGDIQTTVVGPSTDFNTSPTS